MSSDATALAVKIESDVAKEVDDEGKQVSHLFPGDSLVFHPPGRRASLTHLPRAALGLHSELQRRILTALGHRDCDDMDGDRFVMLKRVVVPVLATAHSLVMVLLQTHLDDWGVYLRSLLWWQCIKDLLEYQPGEQVWLPRDNATAESLLSSCALEYTQRLRQRDARREVLSIFERVAEAQGFQLECSLEEVEAFARHRPAYAPLTLTPRFKRCMLQVARALRCQLPVLVTGSTGCGKTAVVLALSELCRAPLLQVSYPCSVLGLPAQRGLAIVSVVDGVLPCCRCT